MNIAIHSLSEINQQATEMFVREMGIVDILRFLSQFNRGTGDYTQERGEWLDQWSLDEIIKEIKIKRNEPTS
jgi:hypothetical protein